MSDLDLSDRVAVVSGGTRGIGQATAQLLAACGASVVVLGRHDTERAQSVAASLPVLAGGSHLGLACDSASPEQIRATYRAIRREYGRVDFLVNNAGMLEDALVGMISDEMVDDLMAVNAMGPIHHLQGAARLMRRSGGGSIVNLTSIIGRVGNVGQVVYGASKAAVIGMTLSAAKELAPANIRVNAVAPGFIATDMTAALPDDKYQERLANIGMQRIGTPEDVAGAVLFLVSDLSTYITGQVLGVDGGMRV